MGVDLHQTKLRQFAVYGLETENHFLVRPKAEVGDRLVTGGIAGAGTDLLTSDEFASFRLDDGNCSDTTPRPIHRHFEPMPCGTLVEEHQGGQRRLPLDGEHVEPTVMVDIGEWCSYPILGGALTGNGKESRHVTALIYEQSWGLATVGGGRGDDVWPRVIVNIGDMDMRCESRKGWYLRSLGDIGKGHAFSIELVEKDPNRNLGFEFQSAAKVLSDHYIRSTVIVEITHCNTSRIILGTH